MIGKNLAKAGDEAQKSILPTAIKIEVTVKEKDVGVRFSKSYSVDTFPCHKMNKRASVLMIVLWILAA